VFFFGIGVVPGVVATTVFAVACAVRLTELGIRQVDPEMVEAAEAFGSPPAQVLRPARRTRCCR
jgi:glycine betaine/proline transport system permease protein